MIGLFVRYPVVAGVVGALFSLPFLILTVTSWVEVQRLPSEPQAISMEVFSATATTDMSQRQWVTVIDGQWDCRFVRIYPVGKNYRTEAIMVNGDRSVVLAVEFSQAIACDRLQGVRPTGLLSRMSQNRFERFQELSGFDSSRDASGAQYFDLCAFCGLENSKGWLALGPVLVLLGWSFLPLFYYWNRKAYG